MGAEPSEKKDPKKRERPEEGGDTDSDDERFQYESRSVIYDALLEDRKYFWKIRERYLRESVAWYNSS